MSTSKSKVSDALKAVCRTSSGLDAARLLAVKTLRTTESACIPVDLWLIAERLRVPVNYCALDVEGLMIDAAAIGEGDAETTFRHDSDEPEGALLTTQEGGTEILLRERKSEGHNEYRERFTLAHELGHFVIRSRIREVYENFRFRTLDQDEERLCNVFAAELLMPPHMLRMELRDCLTRRLPLAAAVLQLSSSFCVSLTALSIKLFELSNRGVFTVIWSFSTGEPVPEWVSCPRLKRLRVVSPTRSNVYRAFVREESTSVQQFDGFVLDGKRFTAFVSSIFMKESQKVMSVVIRDHAAGSRIGITIPECLNELEPDVPAGSPQRRKRSRRRGTDCSDERKMNLNQLSLCL